MAGKKNVKGTKYIIVTAVILAACGIIFLIYSFFIRNPENCKNIINKAIVDQKVKIDDFYKGKKFAIYLVNSVSVCCRPLLNFAELNNDKTVNFRIYVKEDFSDNDIDNFRYAFEVRESIPVEKIKPGNDWLSISALCRYKDDKKSNVYILVNDETLIEDIMRF